MMNKLLSAACIVFLAACLAGCRTRQGSMTIISSRNVTLNRVDLEKLPQVKGITGRDTKFIFLFIPFGVPHLKEALDDALNKGDGDVMLDAVIYNTGWWFLVGQSSIEVKGTVVKTKGTPK